MKKTVLVIGILAGLFLKLFILDFLHISGSSMYPNLKNGETVVVNKLAYGLVVPFKGRFFLQWQEPKNDQTVIFLHDNKIVVKRVYGQSGTHLDFLKNSQYILKVRDFEVPLTEEQYNNLHSFEQVPKGYVLVLGDNFSESVDSRDYGFVSVKNITGKIIGR